MSSRIEGMIYKIYLNWISVQTEGSAVSQNGNRCKIPHAQHHHFFCIEVSRGAGSNVPTHMKVDQNKLRKSSNPTELRRRHPCKVNIFQTIGE